MCRYFPEYPSNILDTRPLPLTCNCMDLNDAIQYKCLNYNLKKHSGRDITDCMEMKSLNIIIAVDSKNGFSTKNTIPWRIPEDFAFFKEQTKRTRDPTKRNALIMGRVTYEMIPSRFRPLAGRKTIVVSTDTSLQYEPGVVVCDSFPAACVIANDDPGIEEVYVCGGERIYNEALQNENCKTIYLTRVFGDFACDRFLNPIEGNWKIQPLIERHNYNSVEYQFFKYERKDDCKCDEKQYLDLISEILQKGELRQDRTNVGTIAMFGHRMEFDLTAGFPLLTTKRVGFKTVLRELLWIISGSTNAKKLQEKGVRIWDGNTSREFLDTRGLHRYPEGDIGACYGFQWRHFGAEYDTCLRNYEGKGVDQLQSVIEQIKRDPQSRRHVVVAWNPKDLDKMALTPCHMSFQFYVSNDGYLSCQMYQRSADLMLGVPFNIASYALLTCMIAKLCGLRPGRFIHITGDTHIYSNHVEGAEMQLQRTPRPFPILEIICADNVETIDDFREEMFRIVEYNPCSKITMKMAV